MKDRIKIIQFIGSLLFSLAFMIKSPLNKISIAQPLRVK